LFRLRRVSRRWHVFMESQLEWSALEFVRLDNPGYRLYVERKGLARMSLIQRVGFELDCLKVVVGERLDVIRVREPIRIPRYVSLVGCPPDLEQNPGYYDL
jgi:hypothetical protein